MTEEDKTRGIDFSNPDGSTYSIGDHSGEIATSEWNTIEGVSGVRFRTWKFAELDESIVDGALVEIQPGNHTPVQFVESAHVFSENFQKGTFYVLHLTREGLTVYHYLADGNSFTLEVSQGEAMCLFTSNKGEVGEVIECEQPGFSTAKLPTIPFGTETFQGLAIPNDFWRVLSALKSGNEDEVDKMVDVTYINELM